MTPKEKAEEFYKKARPHAQYWDCYNDCPLETNHTKEIVLLWIEELIHKTQSIEWLEKNNHKYDKDYTQEYWIEVKKEANEM